MDSNKTLNDAIEKHHRKTTIKLQQLLLQMHLETGSYLDSMVDAIGYHQANCSKIEFETLVQKLNEVKEAVSKIPFGCPARTNLPSRPES